MGGRYGFEPGSSIVDILAGEDADVFLCGSWEGMKTGAW